MTAGRCYLERGRPVTVLVGWGPNRGDDSVFAETYEPVTSDD